ncbi:MAG: Polyprenyl synthetase [Parcubacteria group bacterium GW2011_GWD2_38_11]|nr:MAG: Polyprenyl synthetase [Parcubacteria group bacterium GW2011_GWD2_38_11]
MSTSNWYNEIETSIANLTTKGLLKAFDKFEGADKEVISNLFVKKIEKNKNFRPLVFFVGYCIAKGGKLLKIDSLSNEEKDLIGDITAAIEVENIATYYINHYIDQKGDIKDKQDEKNRVLAGVMCRNIQQSIIENLSLELELKSEIIRLLKEIDQDIAKAQIFEVNTGIFSKIDEFSDESKFLEIYFERCRKISGQFYGRSAEIGYVVGARSIKETEDKRKIEQLYTEMITLLQYSNDIGDYAPPTMHSGTVEKNFYKDYGSDFKNQRLTYPNYLLLKRAKSETDKKFIEVVLKKGFTDKNIVKFIKLMNKYNVLSDCFTLLNHNFNKEKKRLWLPESELRTLISSSIIIVRSNKLLTSVKQLITHSTRSLGSEAFTPGPSASEPRQKFNLSISEKLFRWGGIKKKK